ncbi:MAG: hypothetical protein JSS81_26830 [Acidobacteria bacterium]|nr:hypothetical protein [Acidobacteriota bacterium]
MTIVNSSTKLYNWQRPRRSAVVSGETVISADGHGYAAGASLFRGQTLISARGTTRLPLISPAPILNEVAENAFAKQYFAARLLDNFGSEIRITSASIEAPRGAIGKRVSVNVAKKDLFLITPAKTYTFQIGTRETPAGAISWQTIVENGKLNSRSFALGQNGRQPSDSLSFGTLEPLKNRLNKYPRENTIFYNSRRTSVEIGPGDVIRDTAGNAIPSNTVAINYMTLRDVLDMVRKFTGFSQIVTNIPNFEITRADFPITASFLQSLASIIGIFEPVIFTVGNILYIIDKTAAIPDEFTPRAIANAELSAWSVSAPELSEIDGFLVSFTNDPTNADYFTDRLVQTTEETGSFGDPDYTRTETETTFREWRSSTAPDEILRSEIIRVKRETYIEFLTLVSRRTESHDFDAQGKRLSSQTAIEAQVPDLAADGAPNFLTVREENQTVAYATDPRNPRRQIQSRLVTKTRGLIAVDADNKYFDPDTGEQSAFRQDFLEAHKAGNLAAAMTTDYGPLKTVTETLVDLGNGQYQVSVSQVDHLRKTETNSFSEPKTGDASINSSTGRPSQILVLQDGMTAIDRPGNAVESLAVGELPLYFAIPLARRRLAQRAAQKQTGTAQVIGYSPSIERGTFFRLFDRAGAEVGRFLTIGYRVDVAAMGDGAFVQTSIEADEI